MKIDGVFTVQDKRYKRGWRYTPLGQKRHNKRILVTWAYILGTTLWLASAVNITLFIIMTLVLGAYPVIKIWKRPDKKSIQMTAPAQGIEYQYSAPLGEQRTRKPPSPEMKRQVWIRDGGRCKHCGVSNDDAMTKTGFYLQYDHIIPFSQNGADTVNNLQLLCVTCNTSKGARFTG